MFFSISSFPALWVLTESLSLCVHLAPFHCMKFSPLFRSVHFYIWEIHSIPCLHVWHVCPDKCVFVCIYLLSSLLSLAKIYCQNIGLSLFFIALLVKEEKKTIATSCLCFLFLLFCKTASHLYSTRKSFTTAIIKHIFFMCSTCSTHYHLFYTKVYICSTLKWISVLFDLSSQVIPDIFPKWTAVKNSEHAFIILYQFSTLALQFILSEKSKCAAL